MTGNNRSSNASPPPHGALSAAALSGDAAAVKNLLTQGADPDESRHTGETALTAAVESLNTEVVRLLVEAKADLNKGTDTGFTPLMSAAIEYNGAAILRFLVESGAKLDKENDRGETALEWAKLCGNKENIKILEEAPALQRKIAEQKKAVKSRALRAATVLTRDLPHKKSPFKIKKGLP